MQTIPGYTIREKLYESRQSIIYRALDESERLVVIKILNNVFPTPHELAKFKQEYETSCKFRDITGIIQTYALQEKQNSLMIVMEDFGGSSLKEHLTLGQLSIDDFLNVALQLCKAIINIHECCIMHKDINPSNIIWNKKTGVAKIIDFGISTMLPRETPKFSNPKYLEGTLAYISPEQTGRMNRPMDYRTDLYSLGATFYHLLTNTPPFAGVDALELVHSHLAKKPKPPLEHRTDISAPISEIILKLLQKEADQRYQSCHGLLADLEHCQKQWQTSHGFSSFPIGKQDFSDRFLIAKKIYGRQQQTTQLLETFAKVCAGSSEFLLVCGYSGVGKSALIQEIHRPVTDKQGIFISGKFDQFKRDIPYSALIQAFHELVLQLLAESPDKLNILKKRLQLALGNSGQLVVDIIPEIEAIIGPQQEVQELPPQQSKNRFNQTLLKLIQTFCHHDHPLTLFIDDLQWADLSSLSLIEQLITDSDIGHLMLLGAYRDNEVDETHPLNRSIKIISQIKGELNAIKLQPLKQEDVEQLVADTLRCEVDEVGELAKLCQDKTQGNPFFLTQFLTTLHSEGLISHKNQRWSWDLAEIKNKEITDNVVELMANKITSLPHNVAEILQLAACIGNTFNLKTLSIVADQTIHDVTIHIIAAHIEGLIQPLRGEYRLAKYLNDPDLVFRFVHDRVQQAAISLISEDRQEQIHLQVGRLLLDDVGDNDNVDNYFDIVNHLNYGRTLIPQDEWPQMAKLNLKAGKKAMLTSAHSPALHYFQIGIDFLTQNGWQDHYRTMLTLHEMAAQAASLTGETDLLDQLSQSVQSNARSAKDRINTKEIRIQADIVEFRLAEVLATGLAMLKELEVELPQEEPNEDVLKQEWDKTQHLLASRSVEELYNLPDMVDELQQAIEKLISRIIPAANILGSNWAYLFMMKSAQIIFQHGVSPGSAIALADYAGLYLCSKRDDIEEAYKFSRLAMDYLQRFPTAHLKGRALFVHNVTTAHWKEHHKKENLPALYNAFKTSEETGDFEGMCYSLEHFCFNNFLFGSDLGEVEQEAKCALNIFIKHKITFIQDNPKFIRQAAVNLMRGSSKPYILVGEYYDEYEEKPLLADSQATYCERAIVQLLLRFLFAKYELALEAVTEFDEKSLSYRSLAYYALYVFYESLCRIAICQQSETEARSEHIAKVELNLEKLRRWSKLAPMNYSHKLHLVEAEYFALLGQGRDARDSYELAINEAHKNQYIHEEAIALELAGRYYLQQGSSNLGYYHIRNASYLYLRWGAVSKTKDLEKNYPNLLAHDEKVENKSRDNLTNGIHSTTGPITASLDLPSVIKATQAISQEIDYNSLLKKLLRVILENTGAESCYIIAVDGEKLSLIAELSSNSNDVANIYSEDQITIESVETFPVSQEIIHYVARTAQSIVIDDATMDHRFSESPYLLQNRAKSILCTPLIQGGKVTRAIYLENNLATHAFTFERTEMTKVLGSQAAISLANAQYLTDRKLIENSLREAKDQAESANRAKSEFLAVMSHELRTPLNAILGMADVVLESNLDERQLRCLNVLHRAGKNMLSLVDDILNLAQVESGRVVLEHKDIDLYEFNKNALEINAQNASKKGLLLNFSINANAPGFFKGDPNRIRQVLLNLLGNAVKFTDSGEITLRVSTMDSGHLLFSVKDSGIGISQEQVELIFKPFTQADSSSTRRHGGVGLGLALSKRLVEVMGGDIWVESELGKGSIFNFSIPLNSQNTNQNKTNEQPSRADNPKDKNGVEPATGVSILLVEDVQANVMVIEAYLQDTPHLLEVVFDGKQALEKIKTGNTYDLILMDIQMEGMDGHEATRQIREWEKEQGRQKNVIYALSAHARIEDEAKSIAAGCDGHINKPIAKKTVNDIIANIEK
ncbi:MAG: AAA family ATPase [Magnetococcales bacterium]|nr:AAA family ATPase [Magnetococcales bacterium]